MGATQPKEAKIQEEEPISAITQRYCASCAGGCPICISMPLFVRSILGILFPLHRTTFNVQQVLRRINLFVIYIQ